MADLTNLVIYIHLCLLSAKVSAITCSVVWNSPPTDLRVLSLSAATFAKHLKTYLFSRLVCLLLHPFCSLFSRTTCVSWYHKGKTSLDLKEARDDGFWDGSGISWTICKQSAPYCRQTTTPAPHHSIFTGRMLFWRPANSVNVLKACSVCFVLFKYTRYYYYYSVCLLPVCVCLSVSVCTQLSEIGVELGFILDDLLSSDLNKLIQQAGDNQMDAVRHRAAVSSSSSRDSHDMLLGIGMEWKSICDGEWA